MSPLALFNGSYLGGRPTGIGVVARDLVAALDPALVALADPTGSDRPGSIPIPVDLGPAHGSAGHLRRLRWTQFQLPELVQASGASLLLSPLPEAPLLRGVRSVVIAHDLLPLRHPQPTPLLAYHLLYVPLVLHRAVTVLCNSDATAREVHGRLRVPLRRLVTIPLGFNPGQLRPMGLEREPFLLALGRHDPHKNLHRLLEAFAALSDRAVQLVLVGPHDQRYTPRLKVHARELGIGSRCRWIPWVSDAERLILLNRCMALVIPSLWEGFGLPALEAMACATPVVAARAGALPEVVGDAALLADPCAVPELRAALEELLGSSQLRNTLAARGPKRAAEFRWERAAARVEQVLKELA